MLALPFQVTLASASPRRRELLKRVLDHFEVIVSELDEDSLTQTDPVATAELLALEKARLIARAKPQHLVIGADTVVAIGDLQLAKPSTPFEAVEMLKLLSGKEHRVITGVSLVGPGIEETFSVKTTVTFRDLTDAEIRDYVATGEPMDKAGAYAIQGGAADFVERLDGSLTNVIGLPLEELERRLSALGAG